MLLINIIHTACYFRDFGFNPVVGNVSFELTGGKKPYSKKLAATIDMEAKQLIFQAYK